MNVEFKTLLFDKTRGFFAQKLDQETLQQQLNKLGQSGWSMASSVNIGSQFKPSLLVVLQRNR